jgi:hypothetical protein
VPGQRYNRATRPTEAERTSTGALSDAEIDRRIRALGRKVRAEALAAAKVRKASV